MQTGSNLRPDWRLLLHLALVGDGLDLLCDGLRIADVVLVSDVPVTIEGIGAGHPGGYVDLQDLVGREVFELHHKRTQAITVGGNEDALFGLKFRLDVLLEIRPGTGDGVLEALGVGEVFLRHLAKLCLDVGIALVTWFERRRLDVKGATPDEDLVLAVLSSCVGLVEALQCAIVALVEASGLVDGKSGAVKLVEHNVKGVNGTL